MPSRATTTAVIVTSKEAHAMTFPQRKEAAHRYLDGMIEIIDHEALLRVGYFASDVDVERKKAGAVCRGHNACMVGSLYLAGGVRVRNVGRWHGRPWFVLLGTKHQEKYLRSKRPDLLLAWVAMNVAAGALIDKHGYGVGEYEGEAEQLFETAGNPIYDHDRPAQKRLVRMAQRRLAAMTEMP